MNDNMDTPVTGSEEEVMEPITNPGEETTGEEVKMPVEEGADADEATVAPEGETQNVDPTV